MLSATFLLFSPPPSLKLPGMDIPGCFQTLLDQYMEDLEASRQQYNRQRDDPPLQRNMPPVAGRISWIRQLYQHITTPIKVCPRVQFYLEPSHIAHVCMSLDIYIGRSTINSICASVGSMLQLAALHPFLALLSLSVVYMYSYTAVW